VLNVRSLPQRELAVLPNWGTIPTQSQPEIPEDYAVLPGKTSLEGKVLGEELAADASYIRGTIFRNGILSRWQAEAAAGHYGPIAIEEPPVLQHQSPVDEG